ncbi:MAG TPA: hypothetical protein PKC43_08895 [Phycisphaerales bacterium]|nr:hypothetical protein [Phycisphaerales bacterium]HMP37553.1 hypothetical protein [Phycisphaerales bacterium]
MLHSMSDHSAADHHEADRSATRAADASASPSVDRRADTKTPEHGGGGGAAGSLPASDDAPGRLLAVGSRVRVRQQMPQRDRVWTEAVEGVVVRYRQAKTGSWFAHGRDDRLWLDRLELRLDDGELVVLNLDGYSVIEPAALSG